MPRPTLYYKGEIKPLYVTGARELAGWMFTNGHNVWLWNEETPKCFFADTHLHVGSGYAGIMVVAYFVGGTTGLLRYVF